MSLGRQIKVSLCQYGLTQRWLLEKLKENGFYFDATYLSRILNGHRESKSVEEILNKSAEIIKEYVRKNISS